MNCIIIQNLKTKNIKMYGKLYYILKKIIYQIMAVLHYNIFYIKKNVNIYTAIN